jgi:arylsulfatase A-like enzyme
MKAPLIGIVLLAVGSSLFSSGRNCWAADRPMNVVFILVDDLGWSDLGCCGSDFFETPNIDRLAQTSIRFRNAYAAAPVCSPTRAAILTGKVPARLDMTIWHEGAVDGGPRDRKLLSAPAVANLPREEVTLAEMFHNAGYFTAHIGKWHLGTAAFYPETQGFDLNVGGTFWGAPATFFFPFSGRWHERDPELRYVPGLAPSQPNDYLPDRLTDKALDTLDTLGNQPFFMNLWYYTVHSPVQAPQELINEFQLKQPGQVHKDPIYAAMVKRMDQNVGRVLDKLDQLGLADQTIVVFTSDNGGVDFDVRSIIPTNNAPLRSGKGTLYEGGIRVPLLVRWPGKTSSQGAECPEMVSSQDFFPTFAEFLQQPISDPDVIDGVNLLPTIEDPLHELKRDSLCWHYPHYYPRMTPASAIRHGDWKLIHYYEDERVELYNLDDDVGEKIDLAEINPDIAARLLYELNEWRASVGANEPIRR